MDGKRSSCVICAGEDLTDLVYDPAPLSWSWSSNLRTTLIINGKGGVLHQRQWDNPDLVLSHRLPRTPEAAIKLFEEITKKQPRNTGVIHKSADVISRMLRAFRQVRNVLSPFTTNPVVAVRVFNAFLVGTEQVRQGKVDETSWAECRTVGKALNLIRSDNSNDIPEATFNIPIGELLYDFLEPDPSTGRRLEPDLLIRHASGVLYQEAHFELLYFPGECICHAARLSSLSAAA